MEMDGRIKGKVVVNDKLGSVSSTPSGFEQGTDLYIVSIMQIQRRPRKLPVTQYNISRLAIRCSNFPGKIDFKENVGTKRQWRVCQQAYGQEWSI